MPITYPIRISTILADGLEEEGVAMGGDGRAHCLKCGMNFTLMGSAKRHYRTRHLYAESLSQSCSFCGGTFKNPASLNEHLRTKHSITQKMMKNRIVPE